MPKFRVCEHEGRQDGDRVSGSDCVQILVRGAGQRAERNCMDEFVLFAHEKVHTYL